MSTTVYAVEPVPAKRPGVQRPSTPKVMKGDPGPPGKRGPRGLPGKDSTVPGPRGPVGPGAGKPNAVVRLTLSYLKRDGQAYFSGATVNGTMNLDGVQRKVLAEDSVPEGHDVQVEAKGFVRMYVMGERTYVDVFQTPASLLSRVPASMAKAPQSVPVLLEYFEESA